MKILKGVKNIFDFECKEVMEKETWKLTIESYENSQIFEWELKVAYLYRGNSKTGQDN